MVNVCLRTAFWASVLVLSWTDSASGMSDAFDGVLLDRHTSTTRIQLDGTATTTGRLVLSCVNERGAKNLQNFRLFPSRTNERLKVTAATVYSIAPSPNTSPNKKSVQRPSTNGETAVETKVRSIPSVSIQDRDWFLNLELQSKLSFLHNKKSPLIPFGSLSAGDRVVIDYSIETTRPYLPQVFSREIWIHLQYPEKADAHDHRFLSQAPLHFQASSECLKSVAWKRLQPPDQQSATAYQLKSQTLKATGHCQVAISTHTDWKALQSRQLLAHFLSPGIPKEIGVKSLIEWNEKLGKLKNDPRLTERLSETSDSMGSMRQRLFEALPFEHRRVIEALGPHGTTQPGQLKRLISKATESLKHLGQQKSEFEWGRIGAKRLDELLATKTGDPRDFSIALTLALNVWGIQATPGYILEPLVDGTPPLVDLARLKFMGVLVENLSDKIILDPSLQGGATGLRSTADQHYFVPAWGASAPTWLQTKEVEPSSVQLTQTIEVTKDGAMATRGIGKVFGTLANDLIDTITSSGVASIEDRINSIFGLSTDPRALKPIIRMNSAVGPSTETGQSIIEFTFTGASLKADERLVLKRAPFEWIWVKPSAFLALQPELIDFAQSSELPLPTSLEVRRQIRIVSQNLADDAQSSCRLILPGLSLSLQAKQQGQDILLDEVLLRDLVAEKNTSSEARDSRRTLHNRCLSRYAVGIGAKPQYELADLELKPLELTLLTKGLAKIETAQLPRLRSIGRNPAIKPFVDTRIWLRLEASTDEEKQTPQYQLESAINMLELGRISDNEVINTHTLESARLFRALPTALQNSADYHRLHSRLLRQSSRTKEAAIALQNAIALEPGTTADYFEMAQLAQTTGQLDIAARWLNQILQLSPQLNPSDSARAHFELASIHHQKKNFEAFSREMALTLSLMPKGAEYAVSFVELLNSSKQFDQALTVIQKYLATHFSSNPKAAEVASRTFALKAREIYASSQSDQSLSQAESFALKSLKLEPRLPINYQIAGDLAFRQAKKGDYAALIAAQSYFQKALSLTPIEESLLNVNASWVSAQLAFVNQALSEGRTLAEVIDRSAVRVNRQPAHIRSHESAPNPPK